MMRVLEDLKTQPEGANNSNFTDSAPAAGRGGAPAWLWLLAFAAVLAGLYGRFKGLGAAPLGADEFYIARSVDNLLRTGLPEFLCGGYYNRGPIYQYLVGAVRLFGVSPELAGRSVAAVAGLAVLPAVYVLGRSVHGRTVGLLAAIVMALSIWEIEMARFGRMYAPFQSVFAWYLVFLLRYIADGNRKALVAMIALSLLGVLTWEGAALLGLLNLLPPLIRHREARLRAGDWRYLGGMLALLAILYAMATTDLRTLADVPAYAPGVDIHGGRAGAHPHDTTLRTLTEPGWNVFALLVVALALLPLRWLWSLRSRWLSMTGLCAALVAAVAHQFLVVAGLLALLLLAGLVEWHELWGRKGRTFVLALAGCGVFWLAFGFGTDAWLGNLAGFSPASVEIVARKLFGFPNVIDNVLRPWGRTVPWLALLLGLGLAGLAASVIARGVKPPSAAAVLLIVVVLMVLGVGTASGDRFETRYLFFLYPALVVLAIAAAAAMSKRAAPIAGNSAVAEALLCAGVLACFAVSGDFQPRHLAKIDSPAIGLRVGMRPALVDHYYPHNDVRSAGEWLAKALRPGDIVVSGIPTLDQYYSRADFFFLDEQDHRYEDFACNAGATERWTNMPLLYGTDRLAAHLRTERAVFLVTYPTMGRRIVAQAAARGWHHRTAWTSADGGVDILVLNIR